ncbi:MAG: DUF2339 domain-containing protein [Chitinophagaceae bacterium]
MDAIILLVIAAVIIIALLFNILGKISANKETLYQLQKQLDRLNRRLENADVTTEKIKRPDTVNTALVKETATADIQPKPVIVTPPVEEIKKQTITKDIASIKAVEEVDERKFKEKESWRHKNTDIEKFIGENLINKIGIAILALGISFFVKYAIDKNWINETGRVLIGLAAGGILIGVAHYIRNSYRSFSSVLVGGGLTVFYFTVAFAFHEYHLVSQAAAFIIMVIISGFAVLLSLYYNRQELAILATIGGFITPFLLTTGQENYVALFTYLSILNAGLMVLAWFKRWSSINIIALFFTTFIYGGWLIKRTIFDDPDTLPYKEAFLFATIFYILCIGMNILNSIRMQRKFRAFDFIIVFSINFLFYVAGIAILNHTGGNFKGLFTGILGIVNLLLVFLFYQKKNIDKNFVSLLIGLSLTFVSLIAPIQFKGNHVVLFWAAESVVLLWLYQRSRIIHLKYASVIVSILMSFSLLLTWSDYFNYTNAMPVIINRGFITGIAASLSLFIYYLLLKKETEPVFIQGIATNHVKSFALGIAIMIAYITGALEIDFQFRMHFPESNVNMVYLQAYTFAVAFLLLQLFRRSSLFSLLKFLLTALCVAIYLVCIQYNSDVSSSLLASGEGLLFSAHWLAAILLLYLLFDLVRFFFQKKNDRWQEYRSQFTWIAAISIVLVLSVEMYHLILWTTYRNEDDWTWWTNLYYKAGLTILWSICSFVMIWLGMKYSFRTLRIISLSLFTVTLIKLFSYDIRNIPPGGKIAAFILLGILLLTVSFMYQRLKRILIEDKTK